jgi:hypothetical protein
MAPKVVEQGLDAKKKQISVSKLNDVRLLDSDPCCKSHELNESSEDHALPVIKRSCCANRHKIFMVRPDLPCSAIFEKCVIRLIGLYSISAVVSPQSHL